MDDRPLASVAFNPSRFIVDSPVNCSTVSRMQMSVMLNCGFETNVNMGNNSDEWRSPIDDLSISFGGVLVSSNLNKYFVYENIIRLRIIVMLMSTELKFSGGKCDRLWRAFTSSEWTLSTLSHRLSKFNSKSVNIHDTESAVFGESNRKYSRIFNYLLQ